MTLSHLQKKQKKRDLVIMVYVILMNLWPNRLRNIFTPIIPVKLQNKSLEF